MILKIEMNESEEVDFDFIGSEKEAIISLVIAMNASEEFIGIIKKAIEKYEEIKSISVLKFKKN